MRVCNFRCNSCGYEGDVTRDPNNGAVFCPECRSDDIEELVRCLRCETWGDNYLCEDCKREIDEAISGAISNIRLAPNKTLGYLEARDLLIERVEELD